MFIQKDNTKNLPGSIKNKYIMDLSTNEMMTVIGLGLADWQVEYMFNGFLNMEKEIKRKIIKNHCTI